MLKKIKNCYGQAVMAQYVFMFFLAIGALVAMSVYVQRALQARIRDARNYMIKETRQAHGTNQIGYEYEPYYANTQSVVVREQTHETSLLPGQQVGIFHKLINERVEVETLSEQAPPKNAR